MSTSNVIHLDAERGKRRGEKPMGRAELIDEVVFMLGQGVHPLMIAQTIGKSWRTITKAANALGRSSEVNVIDLDEWRRYSFADKRTGWGYAA